MKLKISLRETARVLKKPLSEAVTILEAQADVSHNETEGALRNHLRAKRNEVGWPCRYQWLRAIYDTYFVFEQSDEHDVERLYRADYSFVDGVLTVGAPTEVRCEVRYIPVDQLLSEARRPFKESFVAAIKESAIAADGTTLIKIVDPGEGSSGYYATEVLKAAAEAGRFPVGLQMFANHMTEEERAKRPEGDVTNLVAVTREAGHWLDNGPRGPGIYAKTGILEHQRPFVKSVANDIGLSLDGMARISWGEVDGREMPIVEEILSVSSVDFVTKAGRGGAIVTLQEAKRIRESAFIQPTNPAKPLALPVDSNQEEKPVTENQANELSAENTRLKESLKRLELQPAARIVAREAIAGLNLPTIVADRIVESHAATPILKDGALDKDAITAAVKESATNEARIAQEAYGWGGGNVEGMGASGTQNTKPLRESDAAVSATLAGLGL